MLCGEHKTILNSVFSCQHEGPVAPYWTYSTVNSSVDVPTLGKSHLCQYKGGVSI